MQAVWTVLRQETQLKLSLTYMQDHGALVAICRQHTGEARISGMCA